MKKISFIIPCYNEQEVIRLTHKRMCELDIGEYEKEIIYIITRTCGRDHLLYRLVGCAT